MTFPHCRQAQPSAGWWFAPMTISWQWERAKGCWESGVCNWRDGGRRRQRTLFGDTPTSLARGWDNRNAPDGEDHRGTPWWNFLVPHLVQKPMVAGRPFLMVMYSTLRVAVLARHRAQYMMAELEDAHTGNPPG